MFSLLSNETASALRSFLSSVMPELTESWWSMKAVPALSFHQQRSVAEKGVTGLSGLDLAALLRVFDSNWFDISAKRNLSREVRTWLKEMQTIRNRWAHLSGVDIPAEDCYRDLETLQRLLEAIGAGNDLVQKIAGMKSSCLVPAKEAPASVAVELPSQIGSHPFAPGSLVALCSNPAIQGAVIQVMPGEPETRYLVFTNGSTETYYERQLQAVVMNPERSLLALDTFHAALSALLLRHPGADNLYSLHAARVDYIPYQFKPVMKLIRADRPRLLIADEVGVGKTIEACLILRELQARRNIRSVLILCPKPLVTERKWQLELKRFDEDFDHLDGPTLRNCLNETDLDGEWPGKKSKVIIPFSLFNEDILHGTAVVRGRRRKKGLLELDPPPHFDLVIVDEAHHLHNSNTLVHQVARFFCDNAEAVVFLTATPIQLGSDNLFTLLNLLRPDLIIDKPSYDHMAAPNPFINRAIDAARAAVDTWQTVGRASLAAAAATEWGTAMLAGNPDFQECYDILGAEPLLPEQRIDFIRKAEQLYTFSSIINRTRRRDIGTFTTRKPVTVAVTFTENQQQLHDTVLAMQGSILARIHGDSFINFMMTTIRRQTASCLYGLVPLLKDILNRRLDEAMLDEIETTGEGVVSGDPDRLRGDIEELLAACATLDGHDPKLEALLGIVRTKQQAANNKILLFSSFRHTLAYIEKHLSAEKFRVGLIHGSVPDESRREYLRRFGLSRSDEDALDILLSSEVGCEGLDYQFCDCLVNYDIPWNPMRIEQRIGRIDRYGQKSEAVAIYNMITPGTVDADIYERCLLRIGVFHAAIGGSEEIIGKITSAIKNVADNLCLTPEERTEKLQIMADNEIREVKEQSDLEDRQAELFGLRLPRQQLKDEVEDAASFWLKPSSLENLVRRYLERRCGAGEHLLGARQAKTLRLNQESRSLLLADYRAFPRKISTVTRHWENWLTGSDQHLAVTFDPEHAAQERSVTFINPVHPLMVQAARALELENPAFTAIRTGSSLIPPGPYPFVVYRWRKSGIQPDFQLVPLCADDRVSSAFFSLLEQGVACDNGEELLPVQTVFDALDTVHHARWNQARADHANRNKQLADFRRQGLLSSHHNRVRVLKEQIALAQNAKIRLMRESELARAEADFARRMQEIDDAEKMADITWQTVAFGVLVVKA